MTTLLRRDVADIEPTTFLRPQRPDDHTEWVRILPWMTPLFIYELGDKDWVRWSVPKELADAWGINGGCACCNESTTIEGEVEDYHIDTAWHETDWWLTANGYENPTGVANRNTTPQEGEMK